MRCYYQLILLHLLAVVCLFLLPSGQVSGKNGLDNRVFLSCETSQNISEKLQLGYRAFFLNSQAPLQQILDETENFLTNNPGKIISLFISDESSVLLEQLQQHKAKHFLAIPGEHSFYDLDACQTNGKRLFVFTPEQTQLSFSQDKHACSFSVQPDFPKDIAGSFEGSQANNLVLFHFDRGLALLNNDSIRAQADSIPNLFNDYTGKLPNFFITDSVALFQRYHNVFSSKRWYASTVEYNNKPLPGIRWKEFPNMVSVGKIHTDEGNLSPVKDGYHFSPDVFYFTRLNANETKIFLARQKDISEEMVLMLDFEQNVENAISENINAPFSNISYIKDSMRGWCAVFNGTDNYIDYDTDIELDDNFSLSVWVYPTELLENRSIIGKGKALSVKIRNGNLMFTSPGIKDHLTDSIVVKLNEWQQLTYIVSAGKTVRFFRNGQLVGVEKAERIESTGHSLLIGSNIWGEFFKGKMDDLVIWNRVLSDEEVNNLYENGIELRQEFKLTSFIWILPVALLVLLGAVFFFRKRKQQPVKKNIPIIKERKVKCPSIELFGGFKIINRDGEDLTARFSTRRKQFFILVLIETIKDGGITSKHLTNNIWAGYSAERAKNNRSTHIQRIREILTQNSGVSIDYTDKKWAIAMENDVYCDLAEYFQLMQQYKQLPAGTWDASLLTQILSVVEHGIPLPNMEDEWLDNFKSKITDQLLETFLPLYQQKDFMAQPEMVVLLSRTLLIFDPLNETVLKYKIKALLEMNKNTQAHECLEHFDKVYQQWYAQPFNKNISEVIDGEESKD